MSMSVRFCRAREDDWRFSKFSSSGHYVVADLKVQPVEVLEINAIGKVLLLKCQQGRENAMGGRVKRRDELRRNLARCTKGRVIEDCKILLDRTACVFAVGRAEQRHESRQRAAVEPAGSPLGRRLGSAIHVALYPSARQTKKRLFVITVTSASAFCDRHHIVNATAALSSVLRNWWSHGPRLCARNDTGNACGGRAAKKELELQSDRGYSLEQRERPLCSATNGLRHWR
jgi:hypothetical protein